MRVDGTAPLGLRLAETQEMLAGSLGLGATDTTQTTATTTKATLAAHTTAPQPSRVPMLLLRLQEAAGNLPSLRRL